MLSLLTSWIPVIGPIINGISSVLNKLQDTKVAEINADAQTRQVEAQTSAQIIEATKDNIGLQVMRDVICLPIAVWSCLLGWDTIVALRWPDLMFHVSDFPPNVAYLPYVVLVFLFGNIGLNAWKTK